MKVLHVIDRLEVGGAEKIFTGITKLLVGKGIDTGALLFTSGSPLEALLDSGVTLHVLNRTNKYSLSALYKAHKICSGYDIVHSHLRHVYAYIRLAQWMFGGKYKLMVHDHGAPTSEVPKRFKGIFKPRYYIGVNKEQLIWAKTTIGINTNHVYLLENTVLNNVKPIEQNTTEQRAMMVANIRKVKNIEFAIELCKAMQWHLDIYGNVSDEIYHQQLLQSIRNQQVQIHSGVTDFSEIYGQHSLAIHCSPKETGPLVLIEYLGAGLPFIAYRTGSAAETISEELPQLFMENFNTHDWQQQIQEIIADETLPEKMIALYHKQFNPEAYINTCLEIYKSVHF